MESTLGNRHEKSGLLNIQQEKIHAFGLNAFNPGSIIVWQPAI